MTADLHRLRTAHRHLWRHVRDVHGIDVAGSAGVIEAAHMAAHRRENTAWHDAWIPDDDPDQEAGR